MYIISPLLTIPLNGMCLISVRDIAKHTKILVEFVTEEIGINNTKRAKGIFKRI